MLKTFSWALALTLLLCLATPLAAQAKKRDLPSSGVTLRVVKDSSPKNAVIYETSSTAPGTRHYVAEFNQSDYQASKQTPYTGLEVLVGINRDLGKHWAIISYFVDGQHLFSRGGLVGDYENWNLVDPSGNPIAAEDERIGIFLDRFASANGQVDNGDDASAVTAGFGLGQRAGSELILWAASMKQCRKKAIIKKICGDWFVRLGAAGRLKFSFAKEESNHMAANAFDCRPHNVAVKGRIRSLKGAYWFKAYYNSNYRGTIPPFLFNGVRDVYRIVC